MNKVIRIQSSKTITVTSGLQYQDVTNKDAHIADRLKVSPDWPKYSIQILEGVGEYPAEIANWPTVKALVEAGIMTISQVIEGKAKEEDTEKVKELKVKESKKKSLDEMTGE